MERIYDSVTGLVGNTPLLEVKNIERIEGLSARLLVKVEAFNPGGSVKDRVAIAMIEQAERDGKLKSGGTIIEPTSGNTGIGLAWASTVKGYKLILTMPETMSEERKRLLRALGATLILTPGSAGMKGAIERARQLHACTPGSMIMGQFENKANPAVHERTTAQEIWRDTVGKVDILVAGVGTGGTLSGTARGLKKHNPALQAVGVEPATSAVLEGKKPGPHKIQGIGAGFVPDNYDPTVVDQVMSVTNDEAMDGARLMAHAEGLLVGISSGAALSAAIAIAKSPENAQKTIVAILPDTGERYLSTDLFG